MMFDLKSVNVAILLVVIYGVSSYPHPSDSNSKASKVLEANSGVVVVEKRGILKKDNIVAKTRLLRADHQKVTRTYKKGKDSVTKERVDNKKLADKERVGKKSAQRNGPTITGKVKLNKKEIEGTIELPSDVYQNHQGIEKNKNPDKINGAITGSVETNEENIKGHVDLPSDVENSRQEDLISETNSGKRQREDFITGNMEVNDENFQGQVVLPSNSDNSNQDKANSINQQNGSIIAGSIETNDKSIEGRIELPSDVDDLSQNNPIGASNSVNQHNEKVLTGSIETNEEYIAGNVNLPNNNDDNLNGENPTGGYYHENKEDALTGSVETNDEYINGHLELPSEPEKENDDLNNDDALVGSVEINDKNIDGHVELPSEPDKENDDLNNDDALVGSVEIDDKNIDGHVELPGEPDKENNDLYNDDDIVGSVDINDKNIDGHVELPSEPDKENNKFNNDDAIVGSVDINDQNIDGHVELPSELDKDNNDPNNDDAIVGSVDINDKNINGHVDLPSEPDKENNDFNNDDAIVGSVDINDKNIDGHVDLPSEPDKENNDLDNDDAIVGSVKINDENIEGNVELPNNDEPEQYIQGKPDNENSKPFASGNNCWMTLSSSSHHLDALDKIDATYANARQKYQDNVGKEFDKKMMQVMIESQGAAPRAVHQAQGDASQIPAGIILGGYCMMRMPGSVLFFHRMKLRNSTRFSVNYLQTDLMKMSLVVRLSLNDLHLVGAYERAISDRKPGTLYYVPNYGEVEMLLKNVYYKMEGHLRMLNNRLLVEVVDSDLINNDILMTYANDSSSIRLQPRNIEDFLERLKADLDLWLKDYFNDYLMYFGIIGGSNSEIKTYEKKKTIQANEYADDVIKDIKHRLRSLGAATVKVPSFKIISTLHAGHIKLMDGQLRGLDSIYRRSVGTTKKEKNIRQLDIIIGFSNLKLEYKYEAAISPDMPPLGGKLILSADELTAHLELAQLGKPATIDLNIDSIIQTKPDSLTIEGPASRMIANFKQLLEHPIIAIMTNTMKHNIKMLKTLTRCEPYIYGTKPRLAGNDQSHSPSDTFIEDTVPDNTEDFQPAPQGDPNDEVPMKEEQNYNINDNLML